MEELSKFKRLLNKAMNHILVTSYVSISFYYQRIRLVHFSILIYVIIITRLIKIT